MKGNPNHCDFKLIEDCAQYSNDAYYKTVAGKFIEDIETDTQAFVSVDGDKIIFTGQGTTSVTDWMIDFRLWRTKVDYLNGILVHSGFIKSYNSIRKDVYEEINRILHESDTKINSIICTGHSLFGAIATVAALDFKLNMPYPLLIKCISFGAPRAGSKLFSTTFNAVIDESYRCVRLKDPISFTPFGPRFHHVSGGLHFNTKSLDFKVPIYNPVGCRVGHHSIGDYLEFIKDVNEGKIVKNVKNDENGKLIVKPPPSKKVRFSKRNRWFFF